MEEAEELPGGPAEASSSREEAAGQGKAAALLGRGRGGHSGHFTAIVKNLCTDVLGPSIIMANVSD